MQIRFINENDDLLEISGIYENSWKYAYKEIIPDSFLESIPKGNWCKSLNSADRLSLVVMDGNRYIGTSSFCKSRFNQFENYGEIVSLYFLPEYIGKGYGTLLLERTVTELKNKGYDNIFLWVLENNIKARRFYESNGFSCADVFLDDNIGGRLLREVAYCCCNMK